MTKPFFSILSCGYRCGEYIKDWADSISGQTFRDFEVIAFFDDFYNTRNQKIDDVISGYTFDGSVVRGNKRFYGMYAISNCISFEAKGEVIVWLDMDDMLRADALQIIYSQYLQHDAWCTYGSYVCSDNKDNNHWCDHMTDEDWKDVRKTWKASKPQTFKRELFNGINIEDFQRGGEWIRRCTDRAVMWPILEMCGPEHTKYITEPIYWLRRYGQAADQTEYEQETIEWLQNRPRYDRI